MDTFMDIGLFVLLIFLVNMGLRIGFKNSYFLHKVFIQQGREMGWTEGYDCGYKDGTINAKMYFLVTDTVPSEDWLKTYKGKRLDTREKILPEIPPNVV